MTTGMYKSGFQNDQIKLMHDFLVDFSLKLSEKVEFFISVIIENWAWDKSGKKSKYKIYFKKAYPKGQIFNMMLFSPIDLNKIMPKNQKK